MNIFLKPCTKRRGLNIGRGVYSDVYELSDFPDKVVKATRCNGRVLSSIVNELSIFAHLQHNCRYLVKIFEVYLHIVTRHGFRPRIIVETVMERGLPYSDNLFDKKDKLRLAAQFLDALNFWKITEFYTEI